MCSQVLGTFRQVLYIAYSLKISYQANFSLLIRKDWKINEINDIQIYVFYLNIKTP